MITALVLTSITGCKSKTKDEDQQTSAKVTESISPTQQPEAEPTTPEVKAEEITENDALDIVTKYVLETVENAENMKLGFYYEDIKTLDEVSNTCHTFRVASESEETSSTIGFYAVSLDGIKLYVMDPITGEYVDSTEVKQSPDNSEQPSDSSSQEYVLSGVSYQVLDEVMEHNGINITFPQFLNETDPTKSDLMNDVIQEDLKSYLISLDLTDLEATLEMKYELNGFEDRVLSVIYKGLYVGKDAAYPVNTYHTVNILVNEDIREIPLNEAFIIDQSFLDMFKDGMYSPYTEDLNLEESVEDFRDLIQTNWDDADLLNFLNSDPNYYFTSQGVIISIEIPHALGDHLEMAIPYEAIESNMNKECPVWKDYMFLNGEG